MAVRTGTIVGLLACQNDSYLRTLRTKVVECRPRKSAKKDKAEGYEVVFEDTVLFPEGGGQPADTGKLTKVDDSSVIEVPNVQRDGLTAVHYVAQALSEGTEVEMAVDWVRRWDHMQQHTGQHLLSAVLDRRNLETLGWNMGSKFNYVEIPRKLSDQEVSEVQNEVNEEIRKAAQITVEKKGEADGIDHHVPDNYDLSNGGVIRVIKIGDLDKNPCCGTHLKNTAEIGALALLHSQPIRGTNSRLFFMAGERVSKYANEVNSIIRKANAALSCQTEDLEDKIARLNLQVKELVAKEKFWSAQVAEYEAAKIKSELESRGFAFLYKPEATNDYLRVLETKIGKLDGDKTYMFVTGATNQQGSIVISGKQVEEYAAKVKEAIPNVKGGGKGKWQGKVPLWEKSSLRSVLSIEKSAD